MTAKTTRISQADARRLWLRAQRLGEAAPFGAGPAAVAAAIRHLGYVQIDTINVIERCHHHILWSRIPEYRASALEAVQSIEKSAFEYWAHALAYIRTDDYRFFVAAMDAWRIQPHPSFAKVDPEPMRRCSPASVIMARSRSAISTIRSWWKKIIPGPAANRPNAC